MKIIENNLNIVKSKAISLVTSKKLMENTKQLSKNFHNQLYQTSGKLSEAYISETNTE